MRKKTNAQVPTYKTLAKINHVVVNVPGASDKYMKFIREHTLETANGTIDVPEHYRRGDKFNGRFLTRHFYIGAEGITEYPQEIVATVEVVEKTNEDGKFLILNIHPRPKGMIGKNFRLSFGCPAGDFQIPGTEKWVAFKRI